MWLQRHLSKVKLALLQQLPLPDRGPVDSSTTFTTFTVFANILFVSPGWHSRSGQLLALQLSKVPAMAAQDVNELPTVLSDLDGSLKQAPEAMKKSGYW